MSGSLNKVMLIGRLGQDPEVRSTQDGRSLCTFSIATSESWNDKSTGEKKEKTEWHRVVVFNEGLVNIIQQYVKKGSNVFIEGQLQTRKWEDKDGIEKYTTEVVLQGFNSTFKMLDSKNSGSSENFSQDGGVEKVESFDSDIDDDIPF
ncbi:MAG: single-stranded DNA-binding protein [Pseudomonadota bacterium]|nr:single-stranded DNA-binding protein [Pseudomonadota bacterium]MEC7735271.1 single-stranded DNA-binding protein [Pseudomonadota bacterium]MEC9392267.1 single-stranded DNA-binding protein [Pseudomonadota bacterium]MEC9459493.1 single-stranded DNA-binding protein [Pseudomonadota bacterium]